MSVDKDWPYDKDNTNRAWQPMYACPPHGDGPKAISRAESVKNDAVPRDHTSTAYTRQIGGDHYKNFKIQPYEFCQVNKLLGLETNVVHYITRHRLKGGKQDLLKAIHCIELLIELEYNEEKGNGST